MEKSMDQKQMVQQILDFNKSTIDSSFNAVCMLQEQSERIGNTMLDNAAWVPEEGKKTIQNLVKTYKQGRDDLKKSVDDGFQKVSDYFKTLGG